MFYCKEEMHFVFFKNFEFLLIVFTPDVILFVPVSFLFFLITPWSNLFPCKEEMISNYHIVPISLNNVTLCLEDKFTVLGL